jgi:hypothetical protein
VKQINLLFENICFNHIPMQIFKIKLALLEPFTFRERALFLASKLGRPVHFVSEKYGIFSKFVGQTQCFIRSSVSIFFHKLSTQGRITSGGESPHHHTYG